MAVDEFDIVRAALRWTLPRDKEAFNIFTQQVQNSGPHADIDAIQGLGAYVIDIITPMLPQIVDEVTAVDLTVSKVDVLTGNETPIGSTTIGLPGQVGANDMVPHIISVLLSGNLSGAGRGNAKKFIPGVNELAAVDSVLGAGPVASFAAGAAIYAADFTEFSIDWAPGTWTLAKGFRTFTTIFTRDILSYIGRRKPVTAA